MKEAPRCSGLLAREAASAEECESAACLDAAVNIGLSERRASRRRIYSKIRGFSVDMVRESRQVCNDRRGHNEQREMLQKVHSGHELLRRNINEKRFIDESTPSNRDRDRTWRWPQAEETLTGRDAS